MQTVFTVIIALSAVVVVALFILKIAEMTWGRAGRAQDRAMMAAFIPNPDNRIDLHVRGWNRDELDRILADYRELYDVPEAFANVAQKADGSFALTFPNDIEPKLFFFLVNYLAYPRSFDLTNRSIGILGHVVLTPAFGPPAAMVGKSAMIYVPARDTEYDLVYAKVDAGPAYKIPFTDLIWHPVGDSRMPVAVKGL